MEHEIVIVGGRHDGFEEVIGQEVIDVGFLVQDEKTPEGAVLHGYRCFDYERDAEGRYVFRPVGQRVASGGEAT